MLVLTHAWPRAFCRQVQEAMDVGHAEAADVLVDGLARPDEARRALDVTVAARVLTLVERRLARAREQASRFFQVPLTDSVGATCLRYHAGGYYRRHRDRDPDFDEATSVRLVTAVVWLNTADGVGPGDFGGGTLRIFPPHGPARDVVAEAGTLLAFPSDWPHEVLPVTRGIRDVVVDWWQ